MRLLRARLVRSPGSTLRAVAGAAIMVTLISVTQVAAAPREQLFASGLLASPLSSTQTLPEPQAADLLSKLKPSRVPAALGLIPGLVADPAAQMPDLDRSEVFDPEGATKAESTSAAPTDCTLAKCVAITIDDGPGPHTSKFLDALAAADQKATFFVVGAEVAKNPGLTVAIVAGGHELGLHSHTHPRMPALGDKAVTREFERSRQAIHDAVGQDLTIYRPPYGVHSKRVGNLAEAAVIMWDVDPQDWRRENQRNLVSHVLKRVQPGSIVLLHETKATAAVLPQLIESLQFEGYQLVTISELLGTDLVHGQIYRSGPAPLEQ